MVHLLYGDEPFLARLELNKLREGLGDESLVDLNTTRLDGAKLTFAELQAACDTIPFLASLRLVVVDGFVGRFEPAVQQAQRPPARGARGRRALDGEWAGLPDYLARVPDTTRLIFQDGPLTERNPLLAVIKEVGRVAQCRRLQRGALEAWVRQHAAELGAAIQPPAVKALIQVAGNDLWLLHGELEKLAVFAGDKPIEAEHVEELVSSAREMSIFTLVDATADRQLGAAQRALYHLLEDGITAPQILAMLAREYRTILLAGALLRKGVKGQDLMSRVGIRQDWLLQRTMERARRHSEAGLRGALLHLAEVDVAIKTGRQEPEVALDLLLLDLCRSAPYQS